MSNPLREGQVPMGKRWQCHLGQVEAQRTIAAWCIWLAAEAFLGRWIVLMAFIIGPLTAGLSLLYLIRTQSQAASVPVVSTTESLLFLPCPKAHVLDYGYWGSHPCLSDGKSITNRGVRTRSRYIPCLGLSNISYRDKGISTTQ